MPNFASTESNAPDADLTALAVSVAKRIFPEQALELPSFVMRGAYTEFTYKRQPQHPASELNQRFFEHLTGERDVVFALGEFDARRLLDA